MADRVSQRSRPSQLSRRSLLVGGASFVGLAASGCKGTPAPPTCTDTTGLSAEDAQTRSTLAYADRAPDPSRTCAKCAQYIAAPNDGACGSCKLLKGPISPAGTCKVFTAKG